ncbi:MAG TPA: hypothetical protein VL688_10395 [Verrucomicrobiae bacterium]|nr:hypothetical protein [Verrucomicrobiae bacterium]
MIMLLFLFLAVAEALALTTLFLAHSAPFSKIFAPIIRRFWGDRFLHYPDNFLLLPKLYGYANAAILTVVGLLVSGITIKLIEAAVLHTGVSTLTAAQSSFQKYFGLLAVWIPAFLIMRYGTSFLMPHIPHSLPAEFMVILLMFVVIQAITAFLFTAVMTSKNGFFKALVEGFGTLKEQGGVLIGAIFIPCVIGVALSFLKSTAPSFVRFYPESVLLILYSGIFITMVIDLYVTSVSTILYLKARNKV